jgi:hypothetical protein
MINETGNWTERRETEKRPLRHRARLPPGAIVGNNVGSGSTPAATRQTTCWKCWWAREVCPGKAISMACFYKPPHWRALSLNAFSERIQTAL